MYALNLLFNLNRKNGLFVPYDKEPDPRDSSLCWMDWKLAAGQAEPDPTQATFNPETLTGWADLEEAGTLRPPQKDHPTAVPIKDDPDWICIRLAQKGPGTVTNVRLVVSFGRPVQLQQPRASPFINAFGNTATTFVKDRLGPGPWWFPLDRIAIRPKTPKKPAHRYEFSVGLIVTNAAGEEFHYGEDPEMDIEM